MHNKLRQISRARNQPKSLNLIYFDCRIYQVEFWMKMKLHIKKFTQSTEGAPTAIISR